jgi:MYXO-CTERM domain-containing protein
MKLRIVLATLTALGCGLSASSALAVWSEHAITRAHGADSVQAVDLDDDGDPDVLGAGWVSTEDLDEHKVFWYENLGDGAFGARLDISDEFEANGAVSVHAADLSGDGLPDVIAALRLANKVVWYENRGGDSFDGQLVLNDNALGARSVFAADLDGVGRIDVLSASAEDDKIAWYENVGAMTFSQERLISVTAIGAASVVAGDLDGDGDVDVASASSGNNTVAWYERDGLIYNQTQVITDAALGVVAVAVADLNGDGHLDVVSASELGDEISWYPNAGKVGDGEAQFGPARLVSDLVRAPNALYPTDLDGDGDVDIVSAADGGNEVAWHRNAGDGSFHPPAIIGSEVSDGGSVHVADVDSDGDLDVIAGASGGVGIVWFENDLNEDWDGDGYGFIDDCAPLVAEIHPGAEERCDGVDNDCDGELDEGPDEDENGISDCDERSTTCRTAAGPPSSMPLWLSFVGLLFLGSRRRSTPLQRSRSLRAD